MSRYANRWENHYAELKDKPSPIKDCPSCGCGFTPMLRGIVVRRRMKWLFFGERPFCCLICSHCKEIVGHEHPRGDFELLRRYRRVV